MKKIYLKFVDFWDGFDTISNFIVDALSIQYEVVLSNDHCKNGKRCIIGA